VGEMTPEQRRMRAEVAVHTSWANTSNRQARTAPARQAALSRFERQVDPAGTMDPDERERRAESARKAHFRQMAYKSARVRAARKATRT
jgi:hypothetical protein